MVGSFYFKPECMYRASYFDGDETGRDFLVFFQNFPNLANPTHFSLTFDKSVMFIVIICSTMF